MGGNPNPRYEFRLVNNEVARVSKELTIRSISVDSVVSK